jgi:hypothetical protein
MYVRLLLHYTYKTSVHSGKPLHIQLPPRRRVLLEKLTGPQLVKKFSTFYESRRFITAFTKACHLSLSWARSIQSMPPILFIKYTFKCYPPIYFYVFQVVSFPKVPPPKPCKLPNIILLNLMTRTIFYEYR